MWQQEVRTARSVNKGHGRLEVRRLDATERLNDYVDWPGLGQVCRIRHERTLVGQYSSETVYAITSLRAEDAGAQRLLEISRRHWAIENRLHCVRDLTLQEDRCRVRAPAAAQALAALRNAALTVLRRLGFDNIQAGLEHCSAHRQKLIHLLRYGITK
jgi:predicted transposase YbfD/YdcC